jgi:septum formation protein
MAGVYHPVMTRLVLASASPRRRELLAAAGLEFEVDVADVDERPVTGDAPPTYVLRVARLKAEAVAARRPDRPVLGADTAVVVGQQMLAKPADALDAARMLEQLSGRVHEVLTGVALAFRGQTYAEIDKTTVWFSKLSPEEIEWYAGSGEPLDKAGGYGIQGLASRFIPRIEGSYTNVVGLPIATVVQLLRRAGVT